MLIKLDENISQVENDILVHHRTFRSPFHVLVFEYPVPNFCFSTVVVISKFVVRHIFWFPLVLRLRLFCRMAKNNSAEGYDIFRSFQDITDGGNTLIVGI